MTITVYYATNRNEAGTAAKPDFGPNLHQKGPEYLRFGSAEVAPPAKAGGDYKVTSVYLAPEQIPGVTSKKSSKEILGSRRIFEELREKMKAEKSDLILSIHGYSSGFRTALERAAQVKQEYAGIGRPVEVGVFSWPADGDMTPWISYYRDRDDAKASGIAIARAFLKLLEYFAELDKSQFCWQRLHLVAHSMGNYALRYALQSIISKYPGKRPEPAEAR
jgi:esterase/lipase superfamily enzyme